MEIVSLEVAKLARDLGFCEPCHYGGDVAGLDIHSAFHLIDESHFAFDDVSKIPGDALLFPYQHQLIDWLEKRLDIYINFYHFKSNNKYDKVTINTRSNDEDEYFTKAIFSPKSKADGINQCLEALIKSATEDKEEDLVEDIDKDYSIILDPFGNTVWVKYRGKWSSHITDFQQADIIYVTRHNDTARELEIYLDYNESLELSVILNIPKVTTPNKEIKLFECNDASADLRNIKICANYQQVKDTKVLFDARDKKKNG